MSTQSRFYSTSLLGASRESVMVHKKVLQFSNVDAMTRPTMKCRSADFPGGQKLSLGRYQRITQARSIAAERTVRCSAHAVRKAGYFP